MQSRYFFALTLLVLSLAPLRAANGPASITSSPTNRTVLQGSPTTFTVAIDGTAPFTFQWFRDAAPIPSATGQSYTLSTTGAADDGAVFFVAVTNALGGAVSGSATLIVDPGLLTTETNNVIPLTKVWKYEQSSILDGVNWTALAYNDAAWLSGPALLYVEEGVIPQKNTALTLGRLTYYFRTTFNLSNINDVTLSLSHYLDDGAIVYLNGSEVYRIAMPAGPAVYATLSDRTVGDAAVEGPFTIAAPNLIAGTNIVAVEVHQVASTSSDIVWGMSLEAVISTRNPDTTPPTVVSAFSVSSNLVTVIFSERVDVESATNRFNYTIDNGVTISSASFGGDNRTIVLATSALTNELTYTLTVSNVRDRAVTPNTIAAGSQKTFMLGGSSYDFQNIGNPTPAGSSVVAGNGFDITGGGSDIGGTADQFAFNYQTLSGNFDLKVRLESLSFADTWTQAGLMARETLDANSRFASILATPSAGGVLYKSRATAGAAAAASGSFPVNYPHTWLRLQRAGNVFTAYGSFDGENWVQVGSGTVAMPNILFVGMAVTSRSNGQAVTAKFRDPMPVVGGTIGPATFPIEPLGPSSRSTAVVITEIMYKPAPRLDSNVLDFVELYNSNPFVEDISGYRLSGDISFTFPPNTVIPGGAFLVVAKNPANMQAVYGSMNVMGPYTNDLPTSGTVRLRNPQEAIYLEVPYSNQPPWPAAADGTGHSLVLARPTYGEGNPEAWASSDQVGGSPGRVDGYSPGALRNVVINEFLANSELPSVDYIELYNHSGSPVNVSGCILTDDKAVDKFVMPNPTIIPARGFLAFQQPTLAFGLNAGGETIYLWNPTRTRVIDVVRFEAQASNISSGRYPDGAADFHPLKNRTLAAANGEILVRDIVINEIMYKPITTENDHEFVELYNQGANAVDLTGWRFTAGISFTFPSNTVLAASNYLVVARNASLLISNYSGVLSAGNTFGNFDGTLANRGERLALSMPDIAYTTNNQGRVSTNIVYVVVDEVTYGIGGNWPQWANEGGSSLELTDARSNHRLAHNWADSDETSKGGWTTVQATGGMDFGLGAANLIEILAMGEGEWLVDNIEVVVGAGPNLLASANASLSSGLGGWLARGTHIRSTHQAAGGNSGGCLHVRASARGDSMANRVVCPLTTAPSGTVTIRADVRWLRGWPEMLLRLHGNHSEAYGRLNVPTNLGTPGQRNSRAIDNAAPAIYQVSHHPVVPRANEAVVVTARIDDPDAVASATLNYRADPATSYIPVTMRDDGSGGDEIAGDGILSATIPGQSVNPLVAFQITAADPLGASRVFPLQDASYTIPFECLVRFGDPVATSGFGTYRQWMTAANVNMWANRPALSNERLFGTFVYGTFRAIYNMSVKWSGSPYHQFGGQPGGDGHYVIELPLDDQCLGTENWNKVHMPGNSPGDDNTSQREQTSYWFARQLGLPWNYRRNVNMYFNGVRRGGANLFMEDTERPGSDFVNSRFPDDTEGHLFKLQPWFEVDDGNARSLGFANQSWCLMNKFTVISNTVPVHKTARYRNNYLTRAAMGTANDYSPVFELVEAADTPTNGWAAHTAAIEGLVDIEEWTRIWAVCHGVGDWDHFGTQNSQNMYAYKPANGKWQLFIWDFNIVLGNSGSWGAGVNLVGTFTPNESRMQNIYANPTFRRMYFRALKELALGPMANVDPLLDTKYAAFLASGITPAAPSAALKGDISSRRASILTTVAAEDSAIFALTVTNVITTSSNLVTLSGVAPVEMKGLRVNGVDYPLSWNSVKGWVLRLAVSQASNVWNLQGFDLRGNAIPGFAATVTVNYSGPIPEPENAIVINEIMFNPTAPEGGYVEFHNRSALAFDLTGWRVNGLDFTFPAGSTLAGDQYLVLAKNRPAFAAAYGGAVPVLEFDGQLDRDGETLSLIRPGATAAEDLVVDKVRYEANPPWPGGTNSSGALQLIDASQDNARASNWADGPGWQSFSFTSVAGGAKLLIFLESAGDFHIDDIQIVAGSVAGVGSNYVQNGGFETTFLSPGPWRANGNHTNSVISTGLAFEGSNSLHVIAPAAGGAAASVFQDLVGIVSSGVYTMSFRYLPSTNGQRVTVRLGSTFRPSIDFRPQFFTPGARNSVIDTLPPYPPVWLNEVQPQNTIGITDGFGDRDPWVELYHAGPNALNLDGYFLANNYNTNLTQWAFPSATVIEPGELKIVWLDGEPQESTAGEPHANFRLTSVNGSVALVRMLGDGPQILDYLNYSGVQPSLSYGDFPNGQPFHRQVFHTVTPGASNGASATPVFINEWLAGNVTALRDPADEDFDDWFELYNPAAVAVDLSGFYLTDNLANRTQFRIPPGYSIPAGGFLLVWADSETSQNDSNRVDLHVNFQLARGGEAIGLFAPDGVTAIDTVAFLAQTNDWSEGRWPDGASGRYFMSTLTPRAANMISGGGNSAPELAPFLNRLVSLGQTLRFIVQATDSDLPAQALTFSLNPGAPEGASVGAADGLFTWTPPIAPTPSLHSITVRVADNGIPSLSATRTFSVTVVPAPPAAITHVEGLVSLGFGTIAGKTYQMEYTDSLGTPSWVPLGNPVVATGGTLALTDSLAPNSQRFYRIVQLD